MQPCFNFTLFEDTQNALDGYFYYANKMILDGTVQFIEKQLPTGYGKCCHVNTQIRTPSGIKLARDIKVGDFVYSMKNNNLVVERVSNKWNTRKKQVKITTRSGSSVIVSPDHRMYTQNGYKKAEELSCNDYFYRFCAGIKSGIEQNQDVVYKDFVWDKIKSIEYIDEYTDMVDFEVENTHNFIANDFVSHNSISDAFFQSWVFGIDINRDILKICGNDKFTDDCFQNVVEKIMLSKRYANVFPYYKKFNCSKAAMFSFCSRKDLKFSIYGSNKSTNLRIVTKLSDVNGVRAMYLMLDDITQRSDMSNQTAHEKDIHAFVHEWFERNYNRNKFYIVASGTTYSQFDILSYLKRVMGGEDAVQSPINKYTKIAKSDYIVPCGVSVFVKVPLLDYDTDESTYPNKISTMSARKKRENNPEEFYAMDQQEPLPPDDSPFYFSNLREYETLPKIGECGRMDTCVAALDTKRRGKDFLSMPICFEAKDPEREDHNVYFLNDWLYDDRTMKECIPLIAAKIIQHHVTRLYVERNTEECIEKIISDELKKSGYTSCVIDEVYSSDPKERRIMAAEGDIKSCIIFPKYGMYASGSNMGKALQSLYGYSYTAKVAHDDAPDSLALFAKRFIMSNHKKLASISSFSR